MSITSETPPILYHYCNSKAFKSIIETKCIWISNMRFMNDYIEHNWLVSLAMDRLKELLKVDEDPFYEKLFNALQTPFSYEPYCGCFSSVGDLLSQWRAYADDGHGFAIGFKTKGIKISTSDPILSIYDEESIGLRKVIYDKTEQQHDIDRLIDEYIYHVTKYAYDKNETTNIALKSFWRRSIVCKNPAFSEEKEWRIVYTPPIDIRKKISTLKFRETRNNLIPYFSLEFGELNDQCPIAEIVLGPKNDAKNNKDILSLFLERNGYATDDITIRFSHASYR